MVYTPADQPVADSTKGDRWFQVVDAETYKILKRLDIGQILAANGHQDYSSAVRPMAIAPGERIAYLQLSFLHGFVEFDLATDKPLRIANLPVSEEAREHAARELPARLRAPRPGDQPRGHEAVRGRARCPTTRRSCTATTSRTRSSPTAASRTGRPTAPTAATASSRSAATTRSSVLDYASEQRGRPDPGRRPPAADADGARPRATRSAACRRRRRRRQRAPRASRPSCGSPARASRGGKLDMRLGMTSRATGRLRAVYHSSGRRTRFSIRDPEARRRRAEAVDGPRRAAARPARASRPASSRSRYAGNARVRPDRLRSRVATRRARLRRTLRDDRRARAGWSRAARSAAARRGVVRLRFDAADESDASLRYRAPIRARRAGALREPLPSKAARGRRPALDPVHGRRGPPHPRRVALQGRRR